MECCVCDQVKSLEGFTKAQRRNKDSAVGGAPNASFRQYTQYTSRDALIALTIRAPRSQESSLKTIRPTMTVTDVLMHQILMRIMYSCPSSPCHIQAQLMFVKEFEGFEPAGLDSTVGGLSLKENTAPHCMPHNDDDLYAEPSDEERPATAAWNQWVSSNAPTNTTRRGPAANTAPSQASTLGCRPRAYSHSLAPSVASTLARSQAGSRSTATKDDVSASPITRSMIFWPVDSYEGAQVCQSPCRTKGGHKTCKTRQNGRTC